MTDQQPPATQNAPAPGADGPWIVNPFIAQVEDKDGPICQLLWPTDIRSEETTWMYAQMIASAPALAAENARLIAENADLKQSVIAFCAPWAVQWAEMCGLSKGTLQDGHYDLLGQCGARLMDFTRQTPLPFPPASAEGEG